jgi:hypothetical protein
MCPLQFKALFTISSNAFHMQEWSNLARDDISCLHLTLLLVSLLVVGWLAQLITSTLKMEIACFSETLAYTS